MGEDGRTHHVGRRLADLRHVDSDRRAASGAFDPAYFLLACALFALSGSLLMLMSQK